MEKLLRKLAYSEHCNGSISDFSLHIATLLWLEGTRNCFVVAYTVVDLFVLSSRRLCRFHPFNIVD
uniref:Uncharacterized protein n=1 Tax=Arundo donax TaxID=35708 RepID=A0A0A8YD79_ARUDO